MSSDCQPITQDSFVFILYLRDFRHSVDGVTDRNAFLKAQLKKYGHIL